MKKISFLASLGLALLPISVSLSPAQASLTQKTVSENSQQMNINSQEILISQARGHDIYNQQGQMAWDNYMVGRVIGKTGGILFVRLPDGTYFNDSASVPPGCDVLVELVDGEYRIVGMTHPGWISRLESDYGWKKVTTVTSLNERTASIWAELDSSTGTTVITPPARTSTPTYTAPVQQPVINQPVRGLW